MVQDTNGSFYGTTYFGGTHVGAPCTNGCGTVFSVSMGLGPFVALQASAGPVGAAVKVLGTDLTGTTGVTFNGTAATFTVVSASEITTKVPAGATTGTLQVVTPGGTLSSNVAYTVESKPLTPAFSPKGGTYTTAQTVSISDGTAGTVIYYTTDGTTPTMSSTQYMGSAITINSTATLKAIALGPDDVLSAVKTGVYIID